MTKRQMEVVRAILQCQLRGGVVSSKELMARLGITRQAVSYLLQGAEACGLLFMAASRSYETLRVIWPAKNLIRPPYKVLWEMVNGRLAYTTRDIRPSQLDHQKGNLHVSCAE